MKDSTKIVSCDRPLKDGHKLYAQTHIAHPIPYNKLNTLHPLVPIPSLDNNVSPFSNQVRSSSWTEKQD